MENIMEKQLLDAVVKLTEVVVENKEAATSKVESKVQVKLEPLEEIEDHSVEEEDEEEEEAKLQVDDEAGKLYVENKEAATPKVESKVQVKLEPLEEIEVHSEEEEEEAKLQFDDKAGKLYVKILIENNKIKAEIDTDEESFESADDASIFSTPTSSRSRSRSRSRSSTPESSPMRPIITSPVPRRQPPPKVEELSETSESSMESEQEEEEEEEEEGDETFVKKEPDVEMMATEADDSENKLVIDENDETESKPDSNKKVDATKDEAQEIADAAGEIQETEAANGISGNAENSENVPVANEQSESEVEVEERLSMKRKLPDNQSDRFEKKKKTSDMDAELCQESKELKNVLK